MLLNTEQEIVMIDKKKNAKFVVIRVRGFDLGMNQERTLAILCDIIKI